MNSIIIDKKKKLTMKYLELDNVIVFFYVIVGTYKSLSELNREYRLVDMQQSGNF